MGKRADWEEIRSLGEGGQSEVLLVRRHARIQERGDCIREINQSNPWVAYTVEPDDPTGKVTEARRTGRFATAVWNYARDEIPSDLGARKDFKVREEGAEAEQQAVERLRSEIVILQQNRPGLPQYLDSNEAERWIVTEFFREGTLEKHPDRYKGQVGLALRALRSLVETVASLHKDNIVHRDIKPANVFIRTDDELVLGDFGIVYLPDRDHVTLTNERVGPRDYMPPWGDLGERLQNVRPNFDVYMLGKLLWCMVAGRLKLPREYHNRPEPEFEKFNLTKIFPKNPDMYIVNSILDQCVVEDPSKCLESAQQLLPILEEKLAIIERGGQMLSDGVPRPCHVCGKGFYRPEGAGTSRPAPEIGLAMQINRSDFVGVLEVQPFACDVCGHVQLFRKL